MDRTQKHHPHGHAPDDTHANCEITVDESAPLLAGNESSDSDNDNDSVSRRSGSNIQNSATHGSMSSSLSSPPSLPRLAPVTTYWTQCKRMLSSTAMLKALLLGQFLSLMLTGTGVTSQILSSDYAVAFPTTQSLLNYVLLLLVYAPVWVHKAGSRSLEQEQTPDNTAPLPSNIPLASIEAESAAHQSPRPTEPGFAVVRSAVAQRWWKYLLVAILDVEANYLLVRAYEYTTITSIQLLDCFSIPCVMVLSWIFLRVRYRWLHVGGVAVCLSGIVVLFVSDLGGNDNGTASNATVGNILCLCGALLYAVCNVSQEYLVKNFNQFEFLSMLGFWGTLVSAVQVAIFERDAIADVGFRYEVVLLVLGFSLCLFTLYSLVPVLLMTTSATFMNLSFLTSDVYTLFFGLFLFGYSLSWVYFVSFSLVVVGLVLYNRYTPALALSKEQQLDGEGKTTLLATPVAVST